MHYIDLTGKRFGKLIVLKIDNSRRSSNGGYYWECKCDCGNIISVTSNHLKTGHTKSCGCLYDISNINKFKYNRILVNDKLKIGICFFNKSDKYFLFDIDDIDCIYNNCWSLDNGYAVSSYIKNNESESEYRLHRIIMSKYYDINGYVIDHINHNTLDNRKCNLRICTCSENSLNKPSMGSNTGYRCIYMVSDNQYRVDVTIENKRFSDTFESLQDAISYRDNIYINNNKTDYLYNPDNDYRNNQDIYNIPLDGFREIIFPFKIIDFDKFDSNG